MKFLCKWGWRKKNISTAITTMTTKSILKECSSSTSHSFLLFFYSVIHSLCQQKYSNLLSHFFKLMNKLTKWNTISTTWRNFNPQYFVYMSMYMFRLFMYCCWNVLWFLSSHLFHVTHLYRVYFFFQRWIIASRWSWNLFLLIPLKLKVM